MRTNKIQFHIKCEWFSRGCGCQADEDESLNLFGLPTTNGIDNIIDL